MQGVFSALGAFLFIPDLASTEGNQHKYLRVEMQGMREGREGSGQELAFVTGQVGRVLSTAILRGNANCLLARLGQVGEGAGQTW